ncbi:hypothetical protein ACFSJU_07530 [Paradesertivirga mongoliensis]|uniref:Uncharacterized protein n=1 Tax=Paradesertivirga mongoliensis TaxID=2100740 RepID=A0ABW4ZK44_9SPHI|nr:hypothetical protein [Pedobacter mongoliensis]
MKLNKIIRSLDLAKSDARDKTIDCIIEYILYSVKENIDVRALKEYINLEFSIELHEEELQSSLVTLVDFNFVKVENKKYSLTLEREAEIRKIDRGNDAARLHRFEQFRTQICGYSSRKLNEIEIEQLWNILTEYIYECFLLQGKSALNFFKPKVDGSSDEDADLISLLKKYCEKLTDRELSTSFKRYIEDFANVISVETLDYLISLSSKAEAFFALGLSKEEYDLIYQDITFDWTVLVDTNFLYSILNLHSHTEYNIAKALIEVGTQLNISFKYLPQTLKELQTKSKDFESVIPSNLSYSQINALVKSDKLDSFAQRYFEKKLEDMDNTPHPSEVISHAQNNLKTRKLEIFRSSFEQLSSSEEYLRIQESKYSQHLAYLDDLRQEKGLKIKGVKDINQISHDIFLREAILFLRSSRINSIADVKYFGVTEDKTLLKFDSFETLKKGVGVSIPAFFSPSILLRKVLKYSPVVTEDYRRAFVSTISTPALVSNTVSSKIAIRSVKYFHNMGISDEKMILNCLKDELFLNKFKDLETKQEELAEFVESEIQRQYVYLEEEYKAAQEELNRQSSTLTELSGDLSETNYQNKKLENQLRDLSGSIQLYEKTLRKMKVQKPSARISNVQLSLDDEVKVKEEENEVTILKIENSNLTGRLNAIESSRKLKAWKNKSLWLLIPIVIIVLQVPLIFFWQASSWNYIAGVLKFANELAPIEQDFFKGIATFAFTLLVIFPARIIIQRFFNKEKQSQYLNAFE